MFKNKIIYSYIILSFWKGKNVAISKIFYHLNFYYLFSLESLLKLFDSYKIFLF